MNDEDKPVKLSGTLSIDLGTIGLITFIVFICLKCTGVWDIPWFWVWFPLWIPIAFAVAVFILVFIIAIIIEAIDNK